MHKWRNMMKNLCRGLGLYLEDAYGKVKWREGVRSWKEVSDFLEKGKVLTIINDDDEKQPFQNDLGVYLVSINLCLKCL